MRVVTLRGRVSLWIIVLGGVLFLFEGCSEDIMYLLFSFFLRYIVLVHEDIIYMPNFFFFLRVIYVTFVFQVFNNNCVN